MRDKSRNGGRITRIRKAKTTELRKRKIHIIGYVGFHFDVGYTDFAGLQLTYIWGNYSIGSVA